jgi:hypothetical protein
MRLLFVLIALCLTVPALGADRVVPSQYETIQMAIDSSTDGDTIIILPGYYSGYGNYNLDLHGKTLTIQSTLPTAPEVIESTIIDCSDDNAQTGIRFQGYPYSTTIIDGLTFWGGSVPGNGGIIYCSNAGPTIRNCNFEFSSANYGGILYCENNSNLTLINCIFSYGTATHGSIIYSRDSKITAQDCEFVDNLCNDYGGAIQLENSIIFFTDCKLANNVQSEQCCDGSVLYADMRSKLMIKHCEFTGNYTNGGSVIETETNINLENCKFISNTTLNGPTVLCGSSSVFRNCLFAGNYNPSGKYGVVSARYSPSTSLRFFNCTFTQNRGYQNNQMGPDGGTLYNSILWPDVNTDRLNLFYCDAASLHQQGIGNINQEPLFVDNGYWQGDVFVAGDYQLQLESSCINAGNPNCIAEQSETDLADQPRIKLGRIDMGCYEGDTHPMDIDKNGIINFADLCKMADVWLWKASWYEK